MSPRASDLRKHGFGHSISVPYQRTHNPSVQGSSPCCPTVRKRRPTCGNASGAPFVIPGRCTLFGTLSALDTLRRPSTHKEKPHTLPEKVWGFIVRPSGADSFRRTRPLNRVELIHARLAGLARAMTKQPHHQVVNPRPLRLEPRPAPLLHATTSLFRLAHRTPTSGGGVSIRPQ